MPTFQVIAHTSKGSPDNDTFTTDAIDTTGANLLIVLVTDAFTAPTALSDNKGNTWAALNRQGDAAVAMAGVRFYYAANTALVGTGHTFTATGIASASLFILACKANANAFASQNGTTGAAVSSIEPGAVVPVAPESLIVTGIACAPTDPGTFSIDDSFIVLEAVAFSGGNHYGGALAYIWQTGAPASANPTWSWTGNKNPSVVAAVFNLFHNGSLLLMFQ